MSKGKCSVQVRSSKGISWATRRGAERMVKGGLADRISPFLVVMKESHAEFRADPVPRARHHSPNLRVLQRDLPDDYRNRELGLPNFCGFLRPHRSGKAA